MGFLDKLRGRGDKAYDAGPEDASAKLKSWVADVMQRLEPSQITFKEGETVEQVVARVLSEEESAVRASADPLRDAKLEALASLRKQFDLAATDPASQPDRPAEATYEMVLGTAKDLSDVQMEVLLQLLSAWSKICGIMLRQPISDALREEYRSPKVGVSQGEQGEELVVTFHAAREMIQLFRDKLRALGLDQG